MPEYWRRLGENCEVAALVSEAIELNGEHQDNGTESDSVQITVLPLPSSVIIEVILVLCLVIPISQDCCKD